MINKELPKFKNGYIYWVINPINGVVNKKEWIDSHSNWADYYNDYMATTKEEAEKKIEKYYKERATK